MTDNVRIFKKRPLVSETRELKKKLSYRDGKCCFYCRNLLDDYELTLEHILAISLGGTNDLSNLCLACHKCNHLVGSKSIVDKIKYRDKFNYKTSTYHRISA